MFQAHEEFARYFDLAVGDVAGMARLALAMAARVSGWQDASRPGVRML
jgi:hypothetical protein